MENSIDTSLVGHVAADLMDKVAAQFGGDAVVETVAVVVEVRHPDGEEGGGEATTITCGCSDPRPWAHSGLLGFASALVEREILP